MFWSSRSIMVPVIAIILAASTVGAAPGEYRGFPTVHVAVNNRIVVSDVPAILMDGTTMLPLRAVAEAFGASVSFESNLGLVSVNTPKGISEAEHKETSDQLAAAKTTIRILENDKARLQEQVSRLTQELASANAKLVQAQTSNKVSGNNSNETPSPSPGSSPEQIKNYLENQYPVLRTAMGPLILRYNVWANTSSYTPYDYVVYMSPPDIQFFYKLQYGTEADPQTKANTVAVMRSHAELVYRIVAKALPNKKLQGQYHYGWYKYPSINEGYVSITLLSWQNFNKGAVSAPGTNYEKAQQGPFRFTPEDDDTKFQ